MCKMNSYMTYTQYDHRDDQQDIGSVYSEKEKSKHGKRCPGKRKAGKAAVLVTHLPLTLYLKVTVPVHLIQDHQEKRDRKPKIPPLKSVQIEVRKNQNNDRNKNLSRSL